VKVTFSEYTPELVKVVLGAVHAKVPFEEPPVRTDWPNVSVDGMALASGHETAGFAGLTPLMFIVVWTVL
jgi:hypothetical protein